jgi:tRNA-Thr(GGU) m(6)t(6)A37 methyltransferase TsaA
MAADATRAGERIVALPANVDAGVYFIGRIRTPFATRADCPRQGDRRAGPLCRIELADPWRDAIEGLTPGQVLDVLYWMHEARRDLVTQSPRHRGLAGTFALRSPARPNPIALSQVDVLAVEPGVLIVRGLDCLDGTPLIDIKPDRCGRE